MRYSSGFGNTLGYILAGSGPARILGAVPAASSDASYCVNPFDDVCKPDRR